MPEKAEDGVLSPSGNAISSSGSSSSTLVIFRTTQLILIVDLELLGGFGALVDGAHRRLILTRMFIVSVIVVIFGASRRVRGENQSLKLAQGVEFWVYGVHARILINTKGAKLSLALWVSIRLCDLRVCQQTTSGLGWS